MSALAQYAKERIRRLGKTQKDLAHLLGVSPAYISQILNGKKNPPDLGRSKYRKQLTTWSRFLSVPEDEVLEMVRHDLHQVPLRPRPRFPDLRTLLCKQLASPTDALIQEIRSMAHHPAEGLALEALVRVYVMLREEGTRGRAYGVTRFLDFCGRAKSNKEFVEGELVKFFSHRSFSWSWDAEAHTVRFHFSTEELRTAEAAVRRLLDRNVPRTDPQTVPVVGHVSAGEGFAYTDGGFAAGEGFEQVEMPPGIAVALAHKLYCVRVRGDSLREFLSEGALLFIKPESWEEIKDGDLVIFKDRKDHTAFVKKVEFAGDSLILKSMNPLYKNRVVRKKDLALLERVMAIVL